MKKLFTSLLALVLLLSTPAFAAGKPVLLNKDGIKIVANDVMFDHDELFDDCELEFDITVSNDTANDYHITSTKAWIDDWEVDALASMEIAAGKKKKEKLTIDLKGADMLTLDAIQKIEALKVQFHFYPKDNFNARKDANKKVNVDWVKEKVAANAK